MTWKKKVVPLPTAGVTRILNASPLANCDGIHRYKESFQVQSAIYL